MESMKKELSVRRQIYLLKVVSGIAWIIAGVCMFLDNKFFLTVRIIAMLLSIGIMIWVHFAKKEAMDEMADFELMRAESNVLKLLHMGFCLVACVLIIFDWPGWEAHVQTEMELHEILCAGIFVYLGIGDFITGILFRHYEEE